MLQASLRSVSVPGRAFGIARSCDSFATDTQAPSHAMLADVAVATASDGIGRIARTCDAPSPARGRHLSRISRWLRQHRGPTRRGEHPMSIQTKPSIVFAHGIWADGSSFSKVIRPLLAEGHEVIAAQYGLDSLESDVAAVVRTLGRVSSPAILVGHSYGGSVITAAGTDDRVARLGYLAAPAPDAAETSPNPGDPVP